jgi:hypothetical protein
MVAKGRGMEACKCSGTRLGGMGCKERGDRMPN